MTKGNIEQLVNAQVTGLSLQQTATVCGMAKSTVQRRLRDPAVQKRIAEERTRVAQLEGDRWRRLKTKALDGLEELLDFAADDRIRLRAIQIALSGSDHSRLLDELAQRQEALNEMLLARIVADDDGELAG